MPSVNRGLMVGSPAPDAMNEVAWCYLEGFGCKKDKVRRAPSGPIPITCGLCHPICVHSRAVAGASLCVPLTSPISLEIAWDAAGLPRTPAPGNGGLSREKAERPRREITMALGINTARSGHKSAVENDLVPKLDPGRTHHMWLTHLYPQFASARYYRLAEKNGNKTLGNTW